MTVLRRQVTHKALPAREFQRFEMAVLCFFLSRMISVGGKNNTKTILKLRCPSHLSEKQSRDSSLSCLDLRFK